MAHARGAFNVFVPTAPLQALPMEKPPVSEKPGDWNCAACGYHNFAGNRSCRRCNAPRAQRAYAASFDGGLRTNAWMYSPMHGQDRIRFMEFQKFVHTIGLPQDELLDWEQDLREQLLMILDHLPVSLPLMEWINFRVGGEIESIIDPSGVTSIQLRHRNSFTAQRRGRGRSRSRDAHVRRERRAPSPPKKVNMPNDDLAATAEEGDPVYEMENEEPEAWPQVETSKGVFSDLRYAGDGWAMHFRHPEKPLCPVHELDLRRVADFLHRNFGLLFEEIRRPSQGVIQMDFGKGYGCVQLYASRLGSEKGNLRINSGDAERVKYLRSIFLRSAWFADAANRSSSATKSLTKSRSDRRNRSRSRSKQKHDTNEQTRASPDLEATAEEGDPVYEMESEEPEPWPQVENDEGVFSEARFNGSGWTLQFRHPNKDVCEVHELDLRRVADYLRNRHGLYYEEIKRTSPGLIQMNFGKGYGCLQFTGKLGPSKGNIRINSSDAERIKYLRSVFLKSSWFTDGTNQLTPSKGVAKASTNVKEERASRSRSRNRSRSLRRPKENQKQQAKSLPSPFDASAEEGDPIYEMENEEPEPWPLVENSEGYFSEGIYTGGGWSMHFRHPENDMREVYELDLVRVADYLRINHGLVYEGFKQSSSGVVQMNFPGKHGNLQFYLTKLGRDRGNLRINTGSHERVKVLRSIFLRSAWFADAENRLLPTEGTAKDSGTDKKNEKKVVDKEFDREDAEFLPKHIEWLDKFPEGEFRPEELKLRAALFEFVGRWQGDAEATLRDLLADSKILQSMHFMPKRFPLEAWVDRRIGSEMMFQDADGTRLGMLCQLCESNEELLVPTSTP